MIIVLDIDGTLADCTHRLHHIQKEPKDWAAFLTPEGVLADTPILRAQRVVEYLSWNGYIFYYLTGRSDRLREATAEWLQKHFSHITNKQNLLMRKEGDHSKPTEVKEAHIKNIHEGYGYVSKLFIDDDPHMHAIYRKYGLSLKAPECWDVLMPEYGNLPVETAWREPSAERSK